MTEQQILDKTIEYLNKYSTCHNNWKIEGLNKIIKTCINYSQENLSFAATLNLNIILERPTLSVRDEYASDVSIEKNRVAHIASEFRIAYNIIKDLAQHGTDNPNAVNAAG